MRTFRREERAEADKVAEEDVVSAWFVITSVAFANGFNPGATAAPAAPSVRL